MNTPIPFLGEIASLVTAMLWAISSIAFTEASKRAGSLFVNVTRLIFAIIFLAITIPLAGISISISLNQFFYLALSGVVGLVFGDTYLFKAFQFIGARLSMLVMSLVPPISAFLAFMFLGESISFVALLGITITVSGIAMVILQRNEVPTSNYKIDKMGIFYAFLGAVGQAAGLILAKRAFDEGELNGFFVGFVRITTAFIILFPLAVMSRRYKNPIKVFLEDKKTMIYTTIGAIFGPFLGITFSMIAIENTKVGIASTIMASVPVIMLPIVYFYYKEKLSIFSIVGAFVTVIGIAILFLR
ncbi:MAG: DMT family transporter [Melioribacteraceae bacterium]|nr:DMT family transporter [Melioribacteraceae bacterium]